MFLPLELILSQMLLSTPSCWKALRHEGTDHNLSQLNLLTRQRPLLVDVAFRVGLSNNRKLAPAIFCDSWVDGHPRGNCVLVYASGPLFPFALDQACLA